MMGSKYIGFDLCSSWLGSDVIFFFSVMLQIEFWCSIEIEFLAMFVVSYGDVMFEFGLWIEDLWLILIWFWFWHVFLYYECYIKMWL